MANNTDERLLLVLSFTREESLTMLRWKHSREFVYNGHMYDIVEQREDGNYIHYTCYKDHKETQLESKKAELIAMAMGQDPARENQSKKLTNFLKTVFSQDSFYWTPISPESSTIQFSAFNFIFSTFTPNPLHPPPKFG